MIEGVRVIAEHMAVSNAYATAFDDDDAARFEELERAVYRLGAALDAKVGATGPERLDHGITHVLTRDERSAAYMADGYARVSGKVGVCEGPSGGGATYILPGVAEANDSSVPLLAITTDIAVGSRGRFTLTELDQEALFRPVTKWNTMIDRLFFQGGFQRNLRSGQSFGYGASVFGGLGLFLEFGLLDIRNDRFAHQIDFGNAKSAFYGLQGYSSFGLDAGRIKPSLPEAR